MQYQNSKEFALQLDKQDKIAPYKERFFIPRTEDNNNTIYFCGNSLGLQPKNLEKYILQEVKDWQKFGVEGHFHAQNAWFPYHEFFTESMAKIIGAKPAETVIMNTLTVNLHLMMVSFYRPTPTRRKIIIEKGAFPSDKYAVDSQIRFHGYNPETDLIQLIPREGEETLRTQDILETIEKHGEELALVMLGGVNYYTGQFFELEKITQKGHEVGTKVGFDLAHVVGNIPLKLHDWQVDFAVWCNYKYMNCGPGSIGGTFVHEKHLSDPNIPRFEGWWGTNKESRFLMKETFEPTKSAESWQLSNAPVFSMSPLFASLEIFEEVGMESLRAKSLLLTGFLEFLLEQVESKNIRIITPKNPSERGCQLSIQVKNSDKSLYENITKAGVIADWREPDVIRVAPVPLYNSFEDVWNFVEILKKDLS